MNLWQGCYDPPPPKFPVQYIPKRLADGTGLLVAQVRVGDDEREWVVRRLGEMWATGFLNDREHGERQLAAFAAVTRDQLNVLLKDLPDDPGEWREIREAPSLVIKSLASKAPDAASPPEAAKPSVLMFFFALATVVFGCVMIATHQEAIAPVLEGAFATAIGIMTLIRETPRM